MYARSWLPVRPPARQLLRCWETSFASSRKIGVSRMASTNLRVLSPSRKKLRVGDIFAMQLPDERCLFGRVILVDLPIEKAPMPTSNLLYIYKDLFDTKTPDIGRLVPDRLLIPPVFTNRLGWAKGVFETID